MSFNLSDAKNTRAKLEALLKQFGEENNMDIKVGRATYGDTFNCSIVIAKSEEGETNTLAKLNYENVIEYTELQAPFGSTFTLQGETYKIVDANPRASKRKIVGENSRGRRYVFTIYQVLEGLKKQAA